MKKLIRQLNLPLIAFIALGLSAYSATGQTSVEKVIQSKLNNFLENVSDRETHDNFWADDLVYTSSSGSRFGKSTIMEGFNNSQEQEETESPYSAEDVNISVFGETAVLTFTLVNQQDDKREEYLNSGTLLKRDGDWKVVCWQATKVPAK